MAPPPSSLTTTLWEEYPYPSDVTIFIRNVRFDVHRAILAAQSTYFHDLFIEIGRRRIELHGDNPTIFAQLLTALYRASQPPPPPVRPVLRVMDAYPADRRIIIIQHHRALKKLRLMLPLYLMAHEYGCECVKEKYEAELSTALDEVLNAYFMRRIPRRAVFALLVPVYAVLPYGALRRRIAYKVDCFAEGDYARPAEVHQRRGLAGLRQWWGFAKLVVGVSGRMAALMSQVPAIAGDVERHKEEVEEEEEEEWMRRLQAAIAQDEKMSWDRKEKFKLRRQMRVNGGKVELFRVSWAYLRPIFRRSS